MADDLDASLPPESQLNYGPVVGDGERRRQDRRQNDRQGKYDRRRNRCVNCIHYSEEADSGKGMCHFHEMPVIALAFACTHFEGLPSEPKTL